MGKAGNKECIFPLTSLQIGDLQSYLSDLRLILALESKKIYILVDNRPWLRDLGSHPAHLWQFMVTKSRLSPFANKKMRRERKEGKEACCTFETNKPKKFQRWFSLIDAVRFSKKRVLLPVKNLQKPSFFLGNELHRTLYGFIVFELAWSDVRGINYLNELQTDTSLAIEAKFMQRWEFDSTAHATSCISSWFSGSLSEQLVLMEYLDSFIGEVFYDAEENLTGKIPTDDDENICSENRCIEEDSLHSSGGNFCVYSATVENGASMPHTPPPPAGPYKRRKVIKSTNPGTEVDFCEEKSNKKDVPLAISETYGADHTNAVEPTQYKDVLILFRFNNPELPFKLRQIIMSDLRLLTLLEAGLPSWVIFLQSYPGFCHVYRPWMCPLARTLYVLISIVTVLIGFYDLYKNVPLLKATAYRLCGPLLDWIDTWEMVSRIKYLGTMLFLQNFEKAVKWFLKITSTTRTFLSVITRPLKPLVSLFEFVLPIWNVCVEVVDAFCSVIWSVIESSFSLVSDLFEILMSPIWLIFSTIWNIAISILYPVFWITNEIFYAPIRMVLSLASFLALTSTGICNTLRDLWQFLSSIFQLASASEATMSTYEVSIWRSLWNDLFSQVFRAIRSILNGFVAFFIACNRHRLSIYNHIQEFIRRLFGRARESELAGSRYSREMRANQNLKKTGISSLMRDMAVGRLFIVQL